MDARSLRFEFRILSDDGEILASDWTFFGMDDFRDTGVETIEIHVYSALRAIKREIADAARKAMLEEPEIEEVA